MMRLRPSEHVALGVSAHGIVAGLGTVVLAGVGAAYLLRRAYEDYQATLRSAEMAPYTICDREGNKLTAAIEGPYMRAGTTVGGLTVGAEISPEDAEALRAVRAGPHCRTLTAGSSYRFWDHLKYLTMGQLPREESGST